jgi:hypothetical protein
LKVFNIVTTSFRYGHNVINGDLSNLAANRALVTATIKLLAPLLVWKWAVIFWVFAISNAKNPSPPCLLLLPIETVNAPIADVRTASFDFPFGYPENSTAFIDPPSAFTANIVFAQCLEKLNYKWVRGIHGNGLFATEVSV